MEETLKLLIMVPSLLGHLDIQGQIWNSRGVIYHLEVNGNSVSSKHPMGAGTHYPVLLTFAGTILHLSLVRL